MGNRNMLDPLENGKATGLQECTTGGLEKVYIAECVLLWGLGGLKWQAAARYSENYWRNFCTLINDVETQRNKRKGYDTLFR